MTPSKAESVISCADDQAVQSWQAEPYRLWSLLDMLRLYATFLNALGACPQIWPLLNSGREPDDEGKAMWFSSVKHVMAEAERLEMPSTLAQCRTIESSVKGSVKVRSFQEHGRQLIELWTRAHDELGGRLMLMLTLDEAKHYEHPTDKWEAAITAFVSSQVDIEEANKCYALGRSTACVFHLMRALESPLKALSAELEIVKHSPTWEGYLSKMAEQIKAKFPDKTKGQAEKREYFSALEGHLRAIKTAWRNPTMHEMAKVYTPEMAHELIVLVRAFMREGAKELKESP